MKQEEILKIIRSNTKYFVSGYFEQAMANGVRTLHHLKNLTDTEAEQVAKAVINKLLGENVYAK